MQWIPQYGHPAAIPDTWMEFIAPPQSKMIQAQKPGYRRANTGWWQPSLDVRVSAGLALTVAQKKRAPGPAYLNVSAPPVTGTGSGGGPSSTGDDC